MRTSGVRRGFSAAASIGLVAAFVLVPGIAAASGGGGCGGPVTDEAGTTVEIEQMCFTPTILRVGIGEDVTFVNRDRVPHTVLGANGAWGGFDALKRGDAATYGFAEAGVYPYVCTWHVGMVGAVVVGDGLGAAFDTTTAAGPVTQGSTMAGGIDQTAASEPAGVDPWAWGAVAGVVGLLLGTTGAIGVRHIRRR